MLKIVNEELSSCLRIIVVNDVCETVTRCADVSIILTAICINVYICIYIYIHIYIYKTLNETAKGNFKNNLIQ